MTMKLKDILDEMELEELTELLISVKEQCGLDTELEARQNVEQGEYTDKEIMDAVAYKRTEGLGPHRVRMTYLPTSLKGVMEDYGEYIE